MTKGRALLVTPVMPNPYGWGLPRRAWSWVHELTKHHELETIVVSQYFSPDPAAAVPGRVMRLQLASAPGKTRRLRDLALPDEPTSAALSSLTGPPPQRIVIFRLYLHDVAALLPKAWRDRAEVDCDDWESATRLSLALVSLRLGRWREAVCRANEARRYFALEWRTLRTYKFVHIAAKEDASRIKRLLRLRNVQTRPNQLAAIAPLPAADRLPTSRTLLFVGTLGYEPNEDAVRWIGVAIAPRLRKIVPDAEFMIAGEASQSLQVFMSAHGLTYVPAPPDVSAVYAKARIAIAPLRGGGGTKVKVLEAWQHKRPVVATSHASRGLAAVPGRHLVIADKAEEFALACAELLLNAEEARRIAEEGHRFFHDSYELNHAAV